MTATDARPTLAATTLAALCTALEARTGGTWTYATHGTAARLYPTGATLPETGQAIPDGTPERYGVRVCPSGDHRRVILAPSYGLANTWGEGHDDRHAAHLRPYDDRRRGETVPLATSTANALAGHIVRTVLPVVLAELADVERAAEADRRYDEATAATRAALDTLPGINFEADRSGGEAARRAYVHGGYITARPQGASVRFEHFSVPAGAALAMLRALAAWTEHGDDEDEDGNVRQVRLEDALGGTLI